MREIIENMGEGEMKNARDVMYSRSWIEDKYSDSERRQQLLGRWQDPWKELLKNGIINLVLTLHLHYCKHSDSSTVPELSMILVGSHLLPRTFLDRNGGGLSD